MAGPWNMIRSLAEEIEQDMLRAEHPSNKSDLLNRISDSANRFAASILCPDSQRCEMLITGFLQGEAPIMLNLSIDDRKPSLVQTHDLDAIGEGAFSALLMLKHRGFDPLSLDFERACYSIYEAKKFSESVESVGPLTRIRFHLPCREPAANQYQFVHLKRESFAALEAHRQRLFLQPVQGIDTFPDNFYSEHGVD